MKNIFIILGLLVVGMVFIGCPNPNMGMGEGEYIENGNESNENNNSEENNQNVENGNGSENGEENNQNVENGNGSENGEENGSSFILSDETIELFKFKIINRNGTFDANYRTLSNSPKHQVEYGNFSYFAKFDIQNNTIEIKEHTNDNCNFTIDYESKIITFDFTNPKTH